MYRNVSETMKTKGDALYKEGRYNTEEFRAIADYFSNEDLSTAPMENLLLLMKMLLMQERDTLPGINRVLIISWLICRMMLN